MVKSKIILAAAAAMAGALFALPSAGTATPLTPMSSVPGLTQDTGKVSGIQDVASRKYRKKRWYNRRAGGHGKYRRGGRYAYRYRYARPYRYYGRSYRYARPYRYRYGYPYYYGYPYPWFPGIGFGIVIH